MSSAVPQQASASAASQTQTQTQAPVRPGAELPPTLTLRGETRRVQREGIRWASDVIDNEGMGKKSSKVCCIYHKPRAVGESSSESDSSSSSSDSDSRSSEQDNSTARMGGKGKARQGRRRNKHLHKHDDDCDHPHSGSDSGDDGPSNRRPSRNAYERMPKVSTKKGGTSSVTEVQR